MGPKKATAGTATHHRYQNRRVTNTRFSHDAAILLAICLVTMTGGVGSALAQAADATDGKQYNSSSPAGYRLATPEPEPLGDYTPCMFDAKQLFTLRSLAPEILPPEDPKELALRQATAITATSPSKEKTELANRLATFTATLNSIQLDSLPAKQKEQINEAAKSAGFNPTTSASIAQASQASKTAFKRADDIGCAMSIYPWKVAADNFGRRVADNYIAIQITVRNLNANNEFLLHDAELAADANIPGLSRFQSSQERRVVRNVGQVGQVLDKRNVSIRVMEGILMIAGTATGFASADYALGFSVYSAGLLPAVKHVFPDLTQDQLNNISDLAFTSSWTNRIVVPKSGAVAFVTFIPSKPLEQACWLQPTYDITKDLMYGTALTACPDPAGTPPAGTDTGATTRQWKTVPYSKWTPIQLQGFEKHAYAVIAGIHISEVHNGTITNVACPSLKDGSVDLSAAVKGILVCPVTGANLDGVSSVKLSQGAKEVPGKIKPDKSGNSADLQFSEDDLNTLDGTYKLFLVDTSGNATDSKQTLKFNQRQPKLTAVDYGPLDLGALAKDKSTITVKLTGENLDRLATVTLVSGMGLTPTSGSIQDASIRATDTTATVTFNIGDIRAHLGKALVLHYTVKSDPKTDQTVPAAIGGVTFTESAAGAAKAPGAAPAVKPKQKPGGH